MKKFFKLSAVVCPVMCLSLCLGGDIPAWEISKIISPDIRNRNYELNSTCIGGNKISAIRTTMLEPINFTLMADSLPPRVYGWNKLEPRKEESRIIRQIMEGSTTALSYFDVHATTIEPGKESHPAHLHTDLEELIIVKEGQVKMTIDGESKIAGPGSICFAMPGDRHGFENAGNTTATYYVFKYKSKLPIDLQSVKKSGGSFMLNWNELPLVKTEKGGRREFFNRPTSQLQKFEMHTTALNAGLDSHAQHTHKEEEIILILKGNVTMHIANNFYGASPGDIIFLPSGIPHALKNTSLEQCEYFAFQWRN